MHFQECIFSLVSKRYKAYANMLSVSQCLNQICQRRVSRILNSYKSNEIRQLCQGEET